MKDEDTKTRPRRPGDGPGGAGETAQRALYLRLVFSEPRQPLDEADIDDILWLDASRRVVGRGPDGERDVALPWDAWSSRRHAAVSMFHFGEQRAALVEDLSSSNGTFVDGARLATGAQAVLKPGQILRIGATLFVVGEGPRAGHPPPLPAGWHARSPAMVALWARALSIAASDDPVLLLGEPGTGKTRLARLLHEASARSGGPFVPMNASAIPLHLEEATLFGVAAGFIPSVKRKEGLLTLARGGTLFLDELADMSAPAQAKLLDAFDPLHRSYLPVGASARQPTECRLVCATNRDVFALASRGELRQDLLSRLAVGQLQVPPLRERREDILPMFWEASAVLDAKRAALSAEAAEALLLARWTENVRGLESLVKRAAHGLALTPDNIREHADRGASPTTPAGSPPTSPGSEPGTAPRPTAPPEAGAPPATSTSTQRWPPTPREWLSLLEAHQWQVSAVADALDMRRETVARALTRTFGPGGSAAARRALTVWQASGRLPAAKQLEAVAPLYEVAAPSAEESVARERWERYGEVPSAS